MRTTAVTTCVCMAAAGGYALSGTEQSRTYDKPVIEVFSAMQRATVPKGLNGALLNEGEVSIARGSGYQLRWTFRHQGKNFGSVVATAVAKGDAKTRVDFAFDPGSANDKSQMFADRQSYARDVGLIVMAEQMDARITGRAPNKDVMALATMSYIKAHGDAVGRETQQIFSDVSKSINAANEIENTPRSMAEATKPSLDLSERKNGHRSDY